MSEAELTWVSKNLRESAPNAPHGIQKLRDELDECYAEMKQFTDFDLGDVFLKLAAWSARASEVRGQLCRHETKSNMALRTKEIDPFIAEVDRQFRTFSRIQALRESEYKMDGKL